MITPPPFPQSHMYYSHVFSRTLTWILVLWIIPLVIAAPMFSRDVFSYAAQGEMVSPEKTIFIVADLSSLWVLIDIYEKDLARVAKGMSAVSTLLLVRVLSRVDLPVLV